ncbi:dynamin family protein [Tumidithrix elongata RA019]|uniref:Dynamin family protein n=1 Tax=Tumidithrix elongata BACA0141 TaxID=2716417 RepID=A0AAW9PTT3_9CYAN|nr:dynamin family protein [Tumidithrix elongata RA019]
MNTQLIGNQAVQVLSQLTRQNLLITDITPQVVFMTNLITLSMGVAHADQKVTEDEVNHLRDTLNKLNLSNRKTIELVLLILTGVKTSKLYSKIDDFLILLVPLSEAEKLLLFGLGYKIAMADSSLDDRERNYLRTLGNRLEIEPRHLDVLEYSFSGKQYIFTDLEEVLTLIDPVRFRDLGTVFINAANNLIEALNKPPKVEEQLSQSTITSVEPRNGEYRKLNDFKIWKQTFRKRVNHLSQLIDDSIQNSLLPITFREKAQNILQRLGSQRFRVAVIGEFSQGKSTLLNALLGEEIQPVRAVPCSGTISVLKYGSVKRVICRYRDLREEEISITEYQAKASISKKAALENREEELLKSEIEEIIFEHPNLSLCRDGVEIIDSPGLNEHPERSSITQKLLKETDAIIFLTNANKVMTQGEIGIIKEMQKQVDMEGTKPLDNLFLVVNFIDCIDNVDDLKDVQDRVNNIAQDSLISGNDRIHFLSAKFALKAILENKSDEYLTTFKNFIESLGNFLTDEKGYVIIQNLTQEFNELAQDCIQELDNAIDNVDISLSASDRQEILEQIGEASGRCVTIHKMVEFLRDQTISISLESWQQYKQGLKARVTAKSEGWKTDYNPIFSRDALIQDYIDQFSSTLQNEVNQWATSQLKDTILTPKLSLLDRGIKEELDALNKSFAHLDEKIGTNFSENFRPILNDFDVSYVVGFAATGVGVGSGAAAAMFFLIPALTVGPAVIAGIIAAVVFGGGLGALGAFDAYKKIINNVCDAGFTEFEKSQVEIEQQIKESINGVFISRSNSVNHIIKQVISDCENRLEQEEKKHQENTDRLRTSISNKKQEFEKEYNTRTNFMPLR